MPPRFLAHAASGLLSLPLAEPEDIEPLSLLEESDGDAESGDSEDSGDSEEEAEELELAALGGKAMMISLSRNIYHR